MTTPAPYVPRHQVPPPVVAPRRYTLIGAIPEVPGDPEGRWERGIEYWSEACNLKTGYVDGWCPPIGEDGQPTDWDKPIEPFEPVRVEAAPFTIVSGIDCRTPVFPSETKAIEALTRGEDLQVERRFWDQQITRPDLVELKAGETVGLDDAVALLEAVASQRYAGLIYLHVPVQALTYMRELEIAERDGPVWRTPYGSVVIPGSGYVDQRGPGDRPPPAAGWWVLATGQPILRRTPVFAHEAFDPSTNRRGAIAERTYVISADCIALAVQVDPCGCTPTTPSGQAAG
ncbi:hypothetical protein [Streptomyces yaizuensis]|uniref:Cupin n=1 Tax=Streptomyces yaizuensis TaxID=2989713 RepID=A0AA86IWV9_9ACTN|nr:hypothetical protein [Streptomyces sp. YSPA8]BDT39523.1 cupin [Streptomyces sp. YSPA8]